MRFRSYSALGDQALSQFYGFAPKEIDPSLAILRSQVESCDYEVLLIARDEPLAVRLNASRHDPQMICTLFNAWRSLGRDCKPLDRQAQWHIIDQIAEPVQSEDRKIIRHNLSLRRCCDSHAKNYFVILLTGQEYCGLDIFDILTLCSLWQLENEHLLVHAAGVIHGGALYLFAGPSGAGKSTIATMSQEKEGILDEDQVQVYLKSNGQYTADAWGYGTRSCNASVRAIFSLVQASTDRLIHLSQAQVARLLMERHIDVMGVMLSDDSAQRSFKLASAIARTIPGYELHFRKSPDFWELIDAEFPD